MKKTIATCIFLACVASAAAGEILESLRTLNGKEYLKVEILSHDAVGLRIRYDSGTARIPFVNLPEDIRKRYGYDPAKAAEQKQKEQQQQAEHDRPPGVPAPPVKPGAGPVVAAPAGQAPLPKLETPDGKTPGELLASVKGLKQKIAVAAKRSVTLKMDARTERSRTRMAPDGVNGSGRPEFKMVPDKSGYAKARKYEEEAALLDRQIAAAKGLIETARKQYEALTGNPMDESVEAPVSE